jgi:glycosyltransferase involved in cell wall biosynthesis
VEAQVSTEPIPRLTIGLPVYNGEQFLAEALEALLAQTFTNFQLIVSDNASTDGTEEICRTYARRDGRIHYLRAAENRGVAWNFNHVVHRAEGECFKWASHDDLCAPEFVARCVDVLDRAPDVVLAYTRSHFIDQRGNVLGEYHNDIDATGPTPFERFRAVLTNLSLCHMQFGVMRLAVLRQTGLHGAYPTSDRVLLAELALFGKLYEIDAPLFRRRDHPTRLARVSHSVDDLATSFDPRRSGILPSLRWMRFVHHLGTILRAPIALDQKRRCVTWLFERRLRSWGVLARAHPQPGAVQDAAPRVFPPLTGSD